MIQKLAMTETIPNRGPELVYSMIGLILSSVFSVILRFQSRVMAESKFSYDDYLIIPALVPSSRLINSS